MTAPAARPRTGASGLRLTVIWLGDVRKCVIPWSEKLGHNKVVACQNFVEMLRACHSDDAVGVC